MNRRSILFAVLGLTLGAGAALAAVHIHAERRDGDHHRADHRGRDDDDRDDEGGARGPAAADPTAASASQPDNSLFQNGARPKASVQ